MNEVVDNESPVKRFLIIVVSSLVMVNGILIIVSTLAEEFVPRFNILSSGLSVGLSVLIGLTLIYLSVLLSKRKQTAWAFTMLAFGIFLGLNLSRFEIRHGHPGAFFFLRDIIIPLFTIAILIYARHSFNVRSDIRSFGVALRTSFIVLLVAFCYGVTGFLLMDKADFHAELSVVDAVHHTIDQFDLTTSNTLTPYTKRARLFLDSLNTVSLAAGIYVLFSLFQPIKARFVLRRLDIEHALRLLNEYNGNSEDFFKLYPSDKMYYFNSIGNAGLAYKVHRGVALVVGDPFGSTTEFPNLIQKFISYCVINDWTIAFIHTESKYTNLYKNAGFNLQKIGEEAVVDLENFLSVVVRDKYFRQIVNKFNREEYTFEVSTPPHSQELVKSLGLISKDWLELPGRTERGFMMGYYTENYIQHCTVGYLKDSSGAIQAFINQIPSFDPLEANYDLLRATKYSLGNSNDFLLVKFIEHLNHEGYKRLNLGLSPLVGMDKDYEDKSLVDNALQFVYANGDKIYSFSGLHRFKNKYQPKWSDRYIVYKGSIRTFTKILNALNGAMKIHGVHSRDKEVSIENFYQRELKVP